MLYSFFIEQYNNPSPGDWVNQVKEDLDDAEICRNCNIIKAKSKYEFTTHIKEKIKKYTLKVLLESKEKHSKMSNLEYKTLKIQPYFIDECITTENARQIFKYRTRMLSFGQNFRGNEDIKNFPICKDHTDDQNKIEECKFLNEKFNDLQKCKLLYTDSTNLESINLLSKVIKARNDEEIKGNKVNLPLL